MHRWNCVLLCIVYLISCHRFVTKHINCLNFLSSIFMNQNWWTRWFKSSLNLCSWQVNFQLASDKCEQDVQSLFNLKRSQSSFKSYNIRCKANWILHLYRESISKIDHDENEIILQSIQNQYQISLIVIMMSIQIQTVLINSLIKASKLLKNWNCF